MALARLAGINVFATGGLGGVHSGGESSMDISADLTELRFVHLEPLLPISAQNLSLSLETRLVNVYSKDVSHDS